MSERAELRTPLEIINRMDWVLHYAKLGTNVINEARQAALKAKLAYERGYKESWLRAEGTVDSRTAEAQLKNWVLLEEMEVAQLALQHAKEKRRDLEDELSKLQTEAGLVKAEMGLTR